jgi:hypothetical protein
MDYNNVINWLSEKNDPIVAYRAATELLGLPSDRASVTDFINSRLPADWYQTRGLWYIYYLTALAECGLDRTDFDSGCFAQVNARLDAFECGCADFMLLRALIALGFGGDDAVRRAITFASEHIMPDGGFICLHRLKNYAHTPKSCYKACLWALSAAAECKKRGVDCAFTEPLVQYFKRHNVFYRTDNPTVPIIGGFDGKVGWRTVDTFHPPEPMRFGLHSVAYSLALLGERELYGMAAQLLAAKRDCEGYYVLDGTLTKSYLPKEHAGKLSKWVTLYALLAEKYAGEK